MRAISSAFRGRTDELSDNVRGKTVGIGTEVPLDVEGSDVVDDYDSDDDDSDDDDDESNDDDGGGGGDDDDDFGRNRTETCADHRSGHNATEEEGGEGAKSAASYKAEAAKLFERNQALQAEIAELEAELEGAKGFL
eukprot:SAG31_NODE_6227_length_2110_cov_2.969170_2_plen_137_part_00